MNECVSQWARSLSCTNCYSYDAPGTLHSPDERRHAREALIRGEQAEAPQLAAATRTAGSDWRNCGSPTTDHINDV